MNNELKGTERWIVPMKTLAGSQQDLMPDPKVNSDAVFDVLDIEHASVKKENPELILETYIKDPYDPRRDPKNWVEDGIDQNNPSQYTSRYIGPRLEDLGPYQRGDQTYDTKVNPNEPLLSILIPTVYTRKKKFDELMWMLNAQRNALPNPNDVEILTLLDNGELMVGAKRNKLLNMAKGTWICYCDDDDRVFGDYIPKILKALETNPDSVGITIFWTDNLFENVRLLVRSLDFKWTHWLMKSDKLTAGRPAHLNPTRSSIAKSVRFNENVVAGEDSEWSAQVAPKLKTHTDVLEPLYHYNFQTEGTITQRPGCREVMRPTLPEGHQWAYRDKKIVELNKYGIVVEKK